MLINQETGKVHQFARQALRRKNAISESTCTETSPCPLCFLPSLDVYLVSAVPERGAREDPGCQSQQLSCASSPRRTDDSLKWQWGKCKLQVRRRPWQHKHSHWFILREGKFGTLL